MEIKPNIFFLFKSTRIKISWSFIFQGSKHTYSELSVQFYIVLYKSKQKMSINLNINRQFAMNITFNIFESVYAVYVQNELLFFNF